MSFTNQRFYPPNEAADWKADRRNLVKAFQDWIGSLEQQDALIPHVQGNWTAVGTFVTPGDAVVTFGQNVCRFTKIGHLVHLEFQLQTSTFTHTTAIGNFTITGLPYKAKTETNYIAEGTLAFQGITKANYTQFSPQIASGGTSLVIAASGSAQPIDAVTAANMPTGGTVVLRGSIFYRI